MTRAHGKSLRLLEQPALPQQEEGKDALDVICMQFLAAGEAIKRFERHWPGVLQQQSPGIDWKGAMGFRDVIAHQYFDLDIEQVMVICEQSLPDLLCAVQDLLNS